MHKQTSDRPPSKKASRITQRFDKPAASRGTDGEQNEGEGSYTATRKYDADVRDFVESGAVEPAARDAAQALDGAERAALVEAETIGERGGTDVERDSNASRGRT